MKKYIRSYTLDKPVRKLEISLEVLAIVDEVAVTASEETFNLPVADRRIADDIECDYDEIVSMVDGVLYGQGFQMIDNYKSNQSNSMYFIFCRETEYEVEQVTLIVGLRVSDHELRHWQGDASDRESKERMRKKIQEFADEYKSLLNDSLDDDEHIDTAMVFVKYENEFYSTYGDMLNKIRQKIKDFKRKIK